MYLTPYNYANNNPIDDFDIDGMQDNQTPTDSTQAGNTYVPPTGGGADTTAAVEPPVVLPAVKVTGTPFVNINPSTSKSDASLLAAPTGGATPNSKPEAVNNIEPAKATSTGKDSVKTASVNSANSTAKTAEQKTSKGNSVTAKKETGPMAMPDGGKLSSTAEERIAKAKEYDKKYTYSLGRTEGTTNCADFVAKVMVQTDYNIAKTFIDSKGYSNVSNIMNAIKNDLGGTIRTDNPKVGDLVFWTGHVEFVSYVNGNDMLIFGGSSGNTPKETGATKKGIIWLDTSEIKTSKSWNGTFVGYWTPK